MLPYTQTFLLRFFPSPACCLLVLLSLASTVTTQKSVTTRNTSATSKTKKVCRCCNVHEKFHHPTSYNRKSDRFVSVQQVVPPHRCRYNERKRLTDLKLSNPWHE